MTTAERIAVVAQRFPPAKVGRFYQARLRSTGGVEPAIWRIKRGPLPRGISFDRERGLFYGTLTRARTYRIQVEIQDSLRVRSASTVTLVVKAAKKPKDELGRARARILHRRWTDEGSVRPRRLHRRRSPRRGGDGDDRRVASAARRGLRKLELPLTEAAEHELVGPSYSHPRGSREKATAARSSSQRDLWQRRMDDHRVRFMRSAASDAARIAKRRDWQAVLVLGDPRWAKPAREQLARSGIRVVPIDVVLDWMRPAALAKRLAPHVEQALA